MPIGFDFRQSGRDTFASEARPPVQGSTGAQASRAGVHLVGGNNQGGMVAGGPQTNPIALTDELGGFFEKVLAPQIEQRQIEQFWKGYNAVQSGTALEEISNSQSGISKIFGPSAYQEGAQYYAAKKQVTEWQKNLLEDPDLKKMPPDEAAKVIAAKSREMMTGNPWADKIIQSDMLQASGPLMATVAKERYKYGQLQARQSWSEALGGEADNLQTIMLKQPDLSDPNGEASIIANMAFSNFANSMVKPEGMDEETYRDSMYDFVSRAAQKGNGYAVRVLQDKGVYALFTDDQREKLDQRIEKLGGAANHAYARAYLMDEIIGVNDQMLHGDLSPLEGAARLQAINDKVTNATGFKSPLFDFGEQVAAGKSIISQVIANEQRLQDRQWAVEDRERNIQAREEFEQNREALQNAQALTAWDAGLAADAVALNPSSRERYDGISMGDYAAGNFARIMRNFAAGFTSERLKDRVQADITATIDSEYSDASARAYTNWQTLFKAMPGAAITYFGKYHQSMMKFDSMRRGGAPAQSAWRRAFGDPTLRASGDIPRSAEKAVDKAIAAQIDGRQGYSIFGGGGMPTLNEGGRYLVTQVLRGRTAISGKNSDVSYEQHAKGELDAALKSGELEIYGAFAIHNKPGTQPLHRMLGMTERDATKVFTGVLGRRLAEVGFKDGLNADNYDIQRYNGPDGKPVLSIIAYGETPAETRQLLIPFSRLEAEARKVASNTTTIPSKVDPYRRVKGETGWQRTQRINREVAAGASPTRSTRK